MLAVALMLGLAFGSGSGPVQARPVASGAERFVDPVASAGSGRPAGSAKAAKQRKPAVKKIKPSSGPVAGGTVVKVKGKRFTKVKKVVFGRTKARIVKVKNPRKVIVVAPRTRRAPCPCGS